MEVKQPAGREGGNGVTLTEPAVDKTLRQIRRSRVWSHFCFPLLLLSGGISFFFSSIFFHNLYFHQPPPSRSIPLVIRTCVSGLRNVSPLVSF